MEKKDKIKPAAGSRATKANVEERLASTQAVGLPCNVLKYCDINTHLCKKLIRCGTNTGLSHITTKP